MMAQELEKRGHKVGSEGYFTELNGGGLLRHIMQPQYSIQYEQCIKNVASMAGRAVQDVLDDLKTHGAVLAFMESADLNRLSSVIDQLEKLCGIVGERLSDASDCQDYLALSHRDTQLQSRASLRDLEQAFDILDGSGSYDLPDSRERIFEQAIRGDILPDEETLAFLDDLQGGNGPEQLEDLWRMRLYRSNPRDYEGRWGVIGSERYVESLENIIFGSSFSSRDLSQGDYSYGDSLKKDIDALAAALYDDLRGPVSDAYIIFEHRERMLEAGGEMEKMTSYRKSYYENPLSQWRRLEDFNNEIIEFETNGEVRAKMVWDNGKNTMYIEADVYFQKTLLIDKAKSAKLDDEFERRVAKYIANFEQWGGNYQVFGNQDLEVKVKINRVKWYAGGALVHVGDINAMRAFAWGGKNIFGWDADGDKVMGLMGSKLTDGATAVHEFGHWLGLQDAYSYDNKGFAWMNAVSPAMFAANLFMADTTLNEQLTYLKKYVNGDMKDPNYQSHDIQGPFPLEGVPAGSFTDFDQSPSIMGDLSLNITANISDNDMEMVVLAFKTGQRQNYQVQFPWEKLSEAMGRGN